LSEGFARPYSARVIKYGMRKESNHGKTRSEWTKEMWRNSQYRQKMLEKRKGKKPSAATIAGGIAFNTGLKHSETRRNINSLSQGGVGFYSVPLALRGFIRMEINAIHPQYSAKQIGAAMQTGNVETNHSVSARKAGEYVRRFGPGKVHAPEDETKYRIAQKLHEEGFISRDMRHWHHLQRLFKGQHFPTDPAELIILESYTKAAEAATTGNIELLSRFFAIGDEIDPAVLESPSITHSQLFIRRKIDPPPAK
jgi:hypothetical protein